MTDLLWQCWELLITLIESSIGMHFVCTFLGDDVQDRHGRKHWLVLTVLFAFTTTLLNMIMAPYHYEGALMVIYCLVVFLYALFVLPGKLLAKAFVSVFFLGCILLNSATICNFISSVTNVPLENLYSESGLLRMLTMVSVQLANYLIFQILLQILGKGKVRLHKTEWLLLLCIFAASVGAIVMVQSSVLQSEMTQNSRILLLGVDMTIVAINLIAIRLIVVLNRHHQTVLENEQLKMQMQYQTQYADTVRQQEEAIHILRHDFNATVTSLRALLQENDRTEIEQYLDSYCESLNATACIVHTNQPFVNAVLNTKLSYAKEQKIQCSCHCPADLPDIQGIDYCSLLGHLLDNAVEAELQQPSPAILVNIAYIDRQLVICVKNRIAESILRTNPKLKTTKGNTSEHGLGILTIQRIADRYNGSVDFYEDDGWFVAQVELLMATG